MDIAKIFEAFIFIPFVVLCYAVGFSLKKIKPFKDKYIPTVVMVFGGALGLVAYFTKLPAFPADHFLMAIILGVASGGAAVGVHQISKQSKKKE